MYTFVHHRSILRRIENPNLQKTNSNERPHHHTHEITEIGISRSDCCISDTKNSVYSNLNAFTGLDRAAFRAL